MLMKKNILLYMAAVAGLVLAGCNKTYAPEAGSLNMTVKASIGNLTKVTTSGVKTTFDEGDSLSLYAWIGSADKVADKLVVNGVVNKFDGESWIPETQMLWKNVHDNHYFIGISPAHKVVDFEADEFVLNPAEYAANDLLIANDLNGQKVAQEFVSNPVSLSFSHAMAKLNVHLKFRSQWAATPEVTSVATTAMDCYKVNYLTKEVTAYGDNAQVKLQALTTTPETYALSFSGLQVPQNGVTVITIVIDGKNFIYEAAEPIVLESGKITNIGLIVGREELTLDEISVEDWDAVDTGLGDLEMVEEKIVDLSELESDYVAKDGETLTGMLAVNVKISIADGATVAFDGLTINGVNDANYKWAGITCVGDATIILKGGSVNSVMGFYETAPGIFIPEGKTLVIKGEGSLTASTYVKDPSVIDSYGYGAGIGGGKDVSCGNIEIQGGNIVAIGGMFAAGIGTAGIENENFTNCGTIKISGGSVVATSQYFGAGIGCGYSGICDSITISGGTVEATGGYAGPGIGSTVGDSSCGDIIISGGTVTATTSNASPGIGSSNEPSVCGNITISGGTVTAIGKEFSPGIGAGGSWNTGGSCGNITITSGVTKVTAIKGTKPEATNSIGAGLNAISCGTVTIGGVVTGNISESPYVYPLPYPIDLSEVTSAYVGSVITDGDWKVYKTVADAIAATETPIAIIAYVGAPGSVEESDANFKGLAIALSDADGDMCTWADGNDWFGYCVSGGVDVELNAALNLINGKACTNTLNTHTTASEDHTHPAAIFAKKNNDTPHPEDATTWFLPSLGQWNLIVQGLAKKTDNLDESGNNNYKATNLNSVITAAGGTGFKNSDYWSSSENTETCAWYIDISGGYATYTNKGNDCYVRSAFAF